MPGVGIKPTTLDSDLKKPAAVDDMRDFISDFNSVQGNSESNFVEHYSKSNSLFKGAIQVLRNAFFVEI